MVLIKKIQDINIEDINIEEIEKLKNEISKMVVILKTTYHPTGPYPGEIIQTLANKCGYSWRNYNFIEHLDEMVNILNIIIQMKLSN